MELTGGSPPNCLGLESTAYSGYGDLEISSGRAMDICIRFNGVNGPLSHSWEITSTLFTKLSREFESVMRELINELNDFIQATKYAEEEASDIVNEVNNIAEEILKELGLE